MLVVTCGVPAKLLEASPANRVPKSAACWPIFCPSISVRKAGACGITGAMVAVGAKAAGAVGENAAGDIGAPAAETEEIGLMAPVPSVAAEFAAAAFAAAVALL
jgi:hypothetical protein